MGFTIPQCAESDSWGPNPEAVDEDRALTYAPFTRSDKFGRGAYLTFFFNPTPPQSAVVFFSFPSPTIHLYA